MRKRHTTSTFSIVAAALGIAAIGNHAAPAAARHHRVSNSDRKWLMAAGNGELKEISLGHLMMKRGKSPAVRDFASHMVMDHSKAQLQLQKLAVSKGVALPTHLGTENRELLSHLEKLRPARRDHDYIQNMVADHFEDVNDFNKEAKHGDDPDIRAWAAKTVPILRRHLQMARATARGIVST
jgi:putative membrane protein